MTYKEFRTGRYSAAEIMPVLDKLITAGLGDCKPQYSITEADFQAAMGIILVDVREKRRTRGYHFPPRVADAQASARRRTLVPRRKERLELWPMASAVTVPGRHQAIPRSE